LTEQQIAFALRQAELVTTVEEVCRKLGISDATFSDRGESSSVYGSASQPTCASGSGTHLGGLKWTQDRQSSNFNKNSAI
jgi:hypothetical protein